MGPLLIFDRGMVIEIETRRLSPNSPRKDVAEMRAILDSIRIEP